MSTYIVTFRLGCEVVTSRHKTLRAARKSLATKAHGRYRIYRAVGLEKRARAKMASIPASSVYPPE